MRLIGKKPAEAIKEKAIGAKRATPYLCPFGRKWKKTFSQCLCLLPVSARSQLVFESLQRSATLCEDQRANSDIPFESVRFDSVKIR